MLKCCQLAQIPNFVCIHYYIVVDFGNCRLTCTHPPGPGRRRSRLPPNYYGYRFYCEVLILTTNTRTPPELFMYVPWVMLNFLYASNMQWMHAYGTMLNSVYSNCDDSWIKTIICIFIKIVPKNKTKYCRAKIKCHWLKWFMQNKLCPYTCRKVK